VKKIINPFVLAGDNSYNCFGCSPANSAGLHLEFWQDDEQLVALWQPKKSFEGWVGVLHGGIQATLMDEAAAWLVFVNLKTAGVTIELSARFLKPVYTSKGQIKVKATLISFEKKVARINCSLEDGEGEVCAASEISYFCFPESIARAKYNYPGIDAFFAAG
jgi:uncharacterized protein (TIGR00369 family)